MGHAIARVLGRFPRWCHDAGTIVILPLLAVLITLDVALRYLFRSPLPWGEEIYGLLLFLVVQLSMAQAWDENKHVRMELLYVRLGRRWRAVADALTAFTGVVFFGVIVLQSARDIPYMSKTSESTEILQIPLWPFRLLVALISLVLVFKLLYGLFAREADAPHEIEYEGVVIAKEQH